MEYVIVVSLAVTHALALAAGGYLHYRYGARTVAAVKAVEGALSQK
jgi:hypothetical protein